MATTSLIIQDNNPYPPVVTITSFSLPTIKIKTGTGKKAKTKTETVIQLDLSGPLNGAGNVGAYRLFSGKTKKRVTTYNKPVALSSAVYNAGTLTVTLYPSGKLNLSLPEQLTVTSALLTDSFGRPLDGGQNMVAHFGK